MYKYIYIYIYIYICVHFFKKYTPKLFCGRKYKKMYGRIYGLDGPGNESRWGEFFRSSRPSLGPTQPPVQWAPDLSRGDVLLTTHALLVPWSWKSRAITLPTLWATTRPVTGTLYLFIQQNIRKYRTFATVRNKILETCKI